MYLGRQVVRRPASTLCPVAGSVVRASTSTPWQMAPTGRPSDQNAATRRCRLVGAEVLAHARSMAAGQEQPVEALHVHRVPADRVGELGRAGQLPVELDRLGLGAELSEHHPGEEAGIAGRAGATVLGGEGHGMTGVGEQAPGHRHLGGVEVTVRQRHQHLHGPAPRVVRSPGRTGVATVLSAPGTGQSTRAAPGPADRSRRPGGTVARPTCEDR